MADKCTAGGRGANPKADGTGQTNGTSNAEGSGKAEGEEGEIKIAAAFHHPRAEWGSLARRHHRHRYGYYWA